MLRVFIFLHDCLRLPLAPGTDVLVLDFGFFAGRRLFDRPQMFLPLRVPT